MRLFIILACSLFVNGCAHQDFFQCYDEATGKWVRCDTYNSLSGPREAIEAPTCYDSTGHEIPCVEDENCDMDMPHADKEV